jgi:hypothetical protein
MEAVNAKTEVLRENKTVKFEHAPYDFRRKKYTVRETEGMEENYICKYYNNFAFTAFSVSQSLIWLLDNQNRFSCVRSDPCSQPVRCLATT